MGKGKGKDGASEEEASSAPKSEGSERTYAREAFSALKDDDEDGFVEAFLGAVRACSKASDTDDDSYESDEE